MAIVLAHELVNEKKLECTTKLSDPLLRHKTRIRAEWIKAKLRQPKRDVVRPLRYARVNSLLLSLSDCIQAFVREGFEYLEDENVKEGTRQFTLDGHVPDLLVFPSGIDLTGSDMYKKGHVVLQDKASCMPVTVLAPPLGSVVIDACAAPGNKTTQLASAVGRSGRVIAIERDPKRFITLEKSLAKHGCDHVKALNRDFLTIEPSEYPEIEYALVDPSCSGSGMLEEFEQTTIDSDPGRLASLSNFQCMILRHAMKFPNLKRVVYSTCSVHREENEEVVQQVLKAAPNFQLVKCPLPLWHRRGLSEYEFGN